MPQHLEKDQPLNQMKRYGLIKYICGPGMTDIVKDVKFALPFALMLSVANTMFISASIKTEIALWNTTQINKIIKIST